VALLRALVPLGFFFLAATPRLARAQAQATPEEGKKPPPKKKVVPLREVVVVGRTDAPGAGRADPVAFATVIRPDEHRHRSVTVADLLRHAVGVDVQGMGGLGSFATVSIRGSTSEQVQVFLDGVLLNRASSGTLSLADLPLWQLERIEVYRGLTPAKFGAAGPGGVIHLISRAAAREPRTTFAASYGSFNTFDFSLTHSGPHSRGDFLASAWVQRSDGNFPYLDNNGTPLNPTDDEVVRRRNNAFGGAGGLLKGTVRVGERQLLRAMLEGMGRVQGVPGIDALQSDRAGFDTRRILGKVDWEHAGLVPGSRLLLSAFATWVRDDFSDPRGELGLGPRSTITSAGTPGMTARFTAALSAAHLVTALAEYRHDGGGSTSSAFGRETRIAIGRHSLALAAEDEISLWAGRLTLNPSVRLDAVASGFSGRVERDATDVYLGAKLGLRLGLATGLALRGSAGRFFRAPTLTELFGDTGLVRGNPDLRPEQGLSLDAGLTWEVRDLGPVKRLFAEAVYFESRLSDLIIFQLGAQGAAVAENQAAAMIRGVEVSTQLDLALGLTASGAYTFQRARSDSDDATLGKLLPGRPQHKVSARGAFTRGDWRVFYELLILDGNYVDRQNRVLLDARVLHGAGVSWRALPELTVSAELLNFTDNRAVDLYRFPLPGRSFFAKLVAEF
jgi:iron complex outermembrane receptor protein